MPTVRCLATGLVQGANEEVVAEDADLLAKCAKYRNPPGERVSPRTLASVPIGAEVSVYWNCNDAPKGVMGNWYSGTVREICFQSRVVTVKYPEDRSLDKVDIRSEYVVWNPKVGRRLP